MENKVGDSTPKPAAVAKLLALLVGVVATWKLFGITLSKGQRRALLHARLGAEPHIATLHELALKYKVAIDGVALQAMANDLALFTMLRPFQDLFGAGVVLLDDTAGQAESEAWTAFLAYYSTLRGMAKHQPALAAELAPIVAFMAAAAKGAAPVPAPADKAAPVPDAAAAPRKARSSGKSAMENKVGDNAPDAATSAKMLADLETVVTTWKPYGVILSPAQRKALHHARLGAEPHVARLHAIALEYKLEIDGIPLQGMVNDFALFGMVRPFQDALRAGLLLVDDTAGQAESEAWEAFLAYYGTLCGMAKHQATLAGEMAPIVAFMATGKAAPG